MAFFGVTHHGDYNQLLHSQPVGSRSPVAFEDIQDSAFEDAFERHAMGDCAEARALQVLCRTGPANRACAGSTCATWRLCTTRPSLHEQ